MDEIHLTYDQAIHSDFLIHWTGKDIDNEFDSDWYDRDKASYTPDNVTELYVERLKDILTHGLMDDQ